MRFIEANNYPLWPKGSKFIDGHMTKMGVGVEKGVGVSTRERERRGGGGEGEKGSRLM